MSPLVVLADDRTGALETAGAIAEAGWRTVVVPFGIAPPDGAECVVIDLASRHLDPSAAAAHAATAADSTAGPLLLHKIDSTLRGNWAAEAAAFGRPVVVVAAFPAAGRVCRDGVVYDHGVPVAEGPAGRDPRRPVRSSRPADHLAAAGVAPYRVIDAETESDVEQAVELWAAEPEAVLSATAAVLGAVARVLRGSRSGPPRPRLDRPALVACGSLHPVARRQLDALRSIGWGTGDRTVLETPAGFDAELRDGAAAQALAAEVHALLGRVRFETLVLVGGDTAEAVLGDVTVEVGGLLGPGMAWCRVAGGGPLVVTKPGGFGDVDTLVRLFDGRMEP